MCVGTRSAGKGSGDKLYGRGEGPEGKDRRMTILITVTIKERRNVGLVQS